MKSVVYKMYRTAMSRGEQPPGIGAAISREEEVGSCALPGQGQVVEQVDMTQNNSCCSRCQVEFQLKNLSFCYLRRDFFYTSQWRWPPCVFIAYRLIVAGYILSWLIFTAITFPGSWPVWLTNWSYLLLTCHLVLAAIIAIIHCDQTPGSRHCCVTSHSAPPPEVSDTSRSSPNGIPDSASFDIPTATTTSSSEYTVDFDNLHDSLPWYIKLDWLLFTTVANMAFIVTVVYFVALFPQLVAIHRVPPLLDDLHLHLVNSLVILLELAISAIPVRLLHMLYPFLFGASYIIFSAIYWAVDHTHVLYPYVLDWNRPGRTIGVVTMLAFVIIPLFQLFIFGLYQIRLVIYRRLTYRQ